MESNFPADRGDWLALIAVVVLLLVWIGAAWPGLFDDEGENE